MANIIKIIFLITLIYLLQGCSSAEYKEEVLKKELTSELKTLKQELPKESATKIIEVNAENFQITKHPIPDNEQIKRVKILGAPLNDVIALITEATDQDIIFQLQSNNTNNRYGTGAVATAVGVNNNINRNNTGINTLTNGLGTNDIMSDDMQLRDSKVYVTASDIGFGRLLKKTVGDKISIRYDDGTYYLGFVKTVTLKVPSLTGLADQIENTLNNLGALNVMHDSITSSITFSAKEKEYQDIMKYLEILRNNLYVIEYDIAIYDVDLKDKYSLGINWSLLPTGDSAGGLITETSSSFGSVGATSTTATLGAVFNTSSMTGSMIGEALSHFGRVESIQKPKLLGIAGTDVVLIDGLEEPYIAGLTSIAVGEQGTKTTTENATALSGLKVILNSNIMDGTVITDINLVVNDIVGYSDFNVGDVTYTQPRIHTKTIKNNIRVQPGVPIVISGLFKHKMDKGYKGIPGLAQTEARILGGSEYEGTDKSEMVIIVTPRVIKYVMK